MRWILPSLLFLYGLGLQAVARAADPSCCGGLKASEKACSCAACHDKCECKISAKPAKETAPAAVQSAAKPVADLRPLPAFCPIPAPAAPAPVGESLCFRPTGNGPPPDLGRAPPCSVSTRAISS